MNSLSYTMPNWWLWIAAIWMILVIALGFVFTRRDHLVFTQRTRFLLWFVRSLASGILLLLILNWSAESTRKSEEMPLIHILTDRSASMAAKDAAGGTSRHDAALQIARNLTTTLPKSTCNSFSVDLESFDSAGPPQGKRSDIGHALSQTLDNSRQQALGGVVLLSDFAASDENTIKETLRIYQNARVPVFPWISGTEKQPNDLRLISAGLIQPSPSQPNLQLLATIESPGYEDQEVALKISCGGQLLESKIIKLSGKRQVVTANFSSPFSGLHFYDIALATLQGEETEVNNSLGAACELSRDPIRVLYMEGSAPTETSFLKDALEADPDMEVHSLHFPRTESEGRTRGKDNRVFQDGRGRAVPSVCHPTLGFPATLQKLLSYDVIILSDIIKEAYTPEQISSMVAFVEEFGGGFVMVGGDTSFGSGGYDQTPIDKIMPIEVANKSDPLWSRYGLLRAALPIGPLHPIMQVGSTADESRTAWTRTFAGFSGINYVERAKPGALVLARTDLTYSPSAMSASPELNGLVLFAVQQIGRGRAMAFCSDTTTAWGDQFEHNWGPGNRNNLYFAKFWNNSVRWLAADRIARKKGQTSLSVSASQCAPGETVLLTIPAASASELSLLEISATEEDRPLDFLPVTWNNPERRWEARCTPRGTGETRFEATYRNSEGNQIKLKAGISVAPADNESIAIAIRPELAAEIARATGGQILTRENAAGVLEKITNKSFVATWKRLDPIWNSPWLLVVLLALVMSEWIIRRREPTG